MEPTPALITPIQPKTTKVQTIGILMLISGILNILFSIGIGVAVLLTFWLIFTLCCLPFAILPLVLGIFEIIMASKMLSATPQRISYQSVQVIAILEICSIIVGNFISMVLGILNLIFLNEPETKAEFI
jgi:hypothetical protein